MRNILSHTVLPAFILAFLWSVPGWTRPILIFTTADDQQHRRAQAANAILTETLERLGMDLRIIPMPSARSLKNANAGIEDGNFLRTKGIGNAYPNLIPVPEPIVVNPIVAFSKNLSIRVDGWKSLLKYHVVCINGWRNCERELIRPKARTMLKNEALLFTLLAKNRAEVGVFGLHTGREVLKRLDIKDVHPLDPPITVSNLYLYVHKKHEELIPGFLRVLRSMKADGSYQRLMGK